VSQSVCPFKTLLFENFRGSEIGKPRRHPITYLFQRSVATDESVGEIKPRDSSLRSEKGELRGYPSLTFFRGSVATDESVGELNQETLRFAMGLENQGGSDSLPVYQ